MEHQESGLLEHVAQPESQEPQVPWDQPEKPVSEARPDCQVSLDHQETQESTGLQEYPHQMEHQVQKVHKEPPVPQDCQEPQESAESLDTQDVPDVTEQQELQEPQDHEELMENQD